MRSTSSSWSPRARSCAAPGPSSYEGLCPFHDERTPSFGIDPVQKVYYCFGCQAKGDVFTFVQETEGVDFKAALELLADRCGVELQREAEDPRAAERRRRRERLLELLGRTTAYYERQLWEAERRDGRGSTCWDGASPRRRCAPFVWATRRAPGIACSWPRARAGFSEQELYATGLAQRSKQDGRLYDRFRGRIMFPLADIRGRVLGLRRPRAGRGAIRGRPKAPEVPEHLRQRPLPQGAAPVWRRPGSRPRHACGRGRAVRGLHRRDRPAPGWDGKCGGADGHSAHRRAGGGAGAHGLHRAARAWMPTAPARRRCCAPRAWPPSASSSCALWSCPRAPIQPMSFSARAVSSRCGRRSRRRCPSCAFAWSVRLRRATTAVRRGATAWWASCARCSQRSRPARCAWS